MDSAGWRCISNSHWARTTRERNLYNLLIKQGADCLAFGSGAGGSVNGYSWMVERNLTTWHESIAAGKKPLMMMTGVPPSVVSSGDTLSRRASKRARVPAG